MRRIIEAGAALTCVALFAVGHAQASPSNTCEAYVSGGSTSYYNCGDSPTASGTAKTNDNANRASAGAAVTTVGNRVAAALRTGPTTTGALDSTETGVSAGDGSARYALWAAIGGTTLSNTVPGAAYKGTLSNQTVGFDALFNDSTVAGLSVFHEGNTFTTDFNSGNLDADAWWAVPYVGHDFGQGSTVDAMLGLAYVSGDASRANGTAKGSFDGYRAMAAVNGHHTLPLGGEWMLRGDLGALWAYSRTNGYDEKGTVARHQAASTSHLVQAKGGARLSYLWGQVEPYAAAYYAYDLVADHVGDDGVAPGGSNDADEFQFYAGLDWYPTDTESVGLEISKVMGRDRSDSMGLLMNARLRF